MDGSSDSRMRAMRWNERIRLVIGVFNRSSVAVLGAAAVGSAFRAGACRRRRPSSPRRHPPRLAGLRPGVAPAGARARRPARARGLMSDLDAAAVGLVGLAPASTIVLVVLHRLRHRRRRRLDVISLRLVSTAAGARRKGP